MGGNAFANAVSGTLPILSTPRMTPEKYQELKALYEHKLRQTLPGRKVNILTEAPEKVDYGDLDFIVESSDEPVDWQHVAGQLGAAGLISHSKQSCSLAVCIDGSTSPKLSIYKHKQNLADLSREITKDEYAQIDLKVVPAELFDWHTFYSAYGDMCGMLGHMVHNLGFTICDRGLMLRLAALDAAKEMNSTNIPAESGRVFLSKDPQKVLRFLGLSYETYQQGFTTADNLYRWLSQCRLLSSTSIRIKRDDASARQKERKRPLYTKFFSEWLPAYFDTENAPTSGSETVSEQPILSRQRQDLALEATACFDRNAEYGQMNTALVRKIQSQNVENLMKPIITQHSGFAKEKRAEIMRGFRRYTSFQDGTPYILRVPHEDDQSELYHFLDENDEMKLQDETRLSEWVKINWEVIKGLERERGKLSKLPI